MDKMDLDPTAGCSGCRNEELTASYLRGGSEVPSRTPRGSCSSDTSGGPAASDSSSGTSDLDSVPIDDIDSADVGALKSKYNPEYNLRKKTIVNRIKTEKRKAQPKQKKPKSSPAPLSKYRRRAANRRERGRMEDINGAFEVLKDVLPRIEEGTKSKMTKITTLRLAMNYISALRSILGLAEDDSSLDLLSDLGSDGDCTETPSVSSGEETCLSPDSSDGDLYMDFLSEMKLDLEGDPNQLLLDCT